MKRYNWGLDDTDLSPEDFQLEHNDGYFDVPRAAPRWHEKLMRDQLNESSNPALPVKRFTKEEILALEAKMKKEGKL